MTGRELEAEYVRGDVDGNPVLHVLPRIPDHPAPVELREGVARWRIAAVSGVCPCGGTATYGDPVAGRVGIGEVRHDHRCPATERRLRKALRRWQQ